MRSLLPLLAFLLASCSARSGGSLSTRASFDQQIDGLAPGKEQNLGDGVFVLLHRVQATEPLGDGWHRAASTEGGFSVEMPVPFNDFRMRSVATDGVDAKVYVIGGKSPGMLAWTASCGARRDGQLSPDGRAPRPETSEALGTPTKAYVRRLDVEGRACFLIVEAQGSDPLPSEADRTRFLQSFRVTGPPTW